jgi:uncharacterized protein (TIGR02145 family)
MRVYAPPFPPSLSLFSLYLKKSLEMKNLFSKWSQAGLTTLFLVLALTLTLTPALHSQSPQGIPYQAVMRNADGSVMASSAVNLTFMIHDGTANGTVVYQESHALTSNAQGLVSCVVGNGVVSEGNFENINWGNGAKFLHVMMGIDASLLDLGTQQMLSVPYSLYAGGTHVSVSPTGDTLTVGGQSVIVPGISAANPPPLFTQGSGVTDIDGNFYPSIIINGQEWMQQNLAVTKYRNGDPIPTGYYNSTWQNTTNGVYAIYNNDAANNTSYGKLYNWYAVNDSRGVCPTGWHVPGDAEWTILENSLGGSSVAGGKMKSTTGYNSPNNGGTNESGFTGLPGGNRDLYGTYYYIGDYGYWWSSTESDSGRAWKRALDFNYSAVLRSHIIKTYGYSVRCVRDSEVAPIQGCTDGAACNFLANANQDDGSCLYLNATCDDGNANTSNDVINGSCVCAGTAVNNNNVVIGQDYQGGKVAYIFQPGDAGYVEGETHGLVAAAQDLPVTYPWGCYGIAITGADGQAVGTGAQNTLDIVNVGCGGAAQACTDLVLNGYSDWFLPSLQELNLLYYNRDSIGGFQSNYWYLSSSEYNSYNAWRFLFFNGDTYAINKNNALYVRAVRAF